MKRNWLISFLINAAILGAIMAVTDLSYESNDDFGIVLRIVEGYDNVLLVNMFLCRALIPIQALVPGVNVFVWMQIIMSFVAFTAVLKILMDQRKSFWFTMICVLVIAVFAFDHYAVIQFTKTSALLVVAGIMIMTDAVIEMRNPLYHFLGLLLVYTGACLRFVNLYVAIAFAALYLLLWAIRYRHDLVSDGYFSGGRIALYIVLVILLCGTYGMNYYSSHNSDITEYSQYNRVRADVIDYPVYQSYDTIKDDLKAMGISKNDLYLIDAWYLDYDGAASQENLEKIDEIYMKSAAVTPSPKETAETFVKDMMKNVRKLEPGGIHIAILVLLAAGGILCLRPKYWIYIILLGGFTILLYLYLYHLGRTVYRASYIADLGAALWLLYYYYSDMQWRNKAGEVSAFAVWERRVLCVIAAFVILTAVYPLATYSNDKAEKLENGVMNSDLTDYMKARENRFFVFSTREKDSAIVYLHPEMAPQPGFEKNMLCFGGWGTKSEYTMDHLKAYGLNNMFGDIIDNDRVYVVEQKNMQKLEKYFNKWYGQDGKEITFVLEDEIAGQKIWQVVTR